MASSDQGRRPNLLILSGGSQKAWAHVGVLQWLEEQRIPVDGVAGTSGGALIGAMYSQGATASEIRQLLRYLSNDFRYGSWVEDQSSPEPLKVARDAAWARLLGGEPKFDSLSIESKAHSRNYPFLLQWGSKGISLQSNGPMIGIILSRISLGHNRGAEFSSAHIPFFASVVNEAVSPGSSVLLSRGSLVTALRGSMAIPILFAPVPCSSVALPELYPHSPGPHKALLVDGGVLNNFPAIDAQNAFSAPQTPLLIGSSVMPDYSKKLEPEVRLDTGKSSSIGKLPAGLLKTVGAPAGLANEEYVSGQGVLVRHGSECQHHRSECQGSESLGSECNKSESWGWSDTERGADLGYAGMDKLSKESIATLMSAQATEIEWQEYTSRQAVARARRHLVPKAVEIMVVAGNGDLITDQDDIRIKALTTRFEKYKGKVLDARELHHPGAGLEELENEILSACGSRKYMYGLYERRGETLILTFMESTLGEPLSQMGFELSRSDGLKMDGSTRVSATWPGAGLSEKASGELSVGNEFGARLRMSVGPDRLSSRLTHSFEAGFLETRSPQYSFAEPAVLVAQHEQRETYLQWESRYEFSRFVGIYARLNGLRKDRRVAVGHPDTVSGDAVEWNASLGWLLDQTDDGLMPLRGVRVDVATTLTDQWRTINGIESSLDGAISLRARGEAYFTIDKQYGLTLFGKVDYLDVGDGLAFHEFRLGGPGRLYGLPQGIMFGTRGEYYSAGLKLPLTHGDGLLKMSAAILQFESGYVARTGNQLSRGESLTAMYELGTLAGLFQAGAALNNSGNVRFFLNLVSGG